MSKSQEEKINPLRMIDAMQRFSMEKLVMHFNEGAQSINITPETIMSKSLHHFTEFNINSQLHSGRIELPSHREHFNHNDEIIISQAVTNLSCWETEFRNDDC